MLIPVALPQLCAAQKWFYTPVTLKDKKHVVTSYVHPKCVYILCYCASVKYYGFSCSSKLGKENRNKPIYGFSLYHILYRFLKHMADFKMLLIRIILRKSNLKRKNDLYQYYVLMKMKI